MFRENNERDSCFIIHHNVNQRGLLFSKIRLKKIFATNCDDVLGIVSTIQRARTYTDHRFLDEPPAASSQSQRVKLHAMLYWWKLSKQRKVVVLDPFVLKEEVGVTNQRV